MKCGSVKIFLKKKVIFVCDKAYVLATNFFFLGPLNLIY